jgi:hypothetical protein
LNTLLHRRHVFFAWLCGVLAALFILASVSAPEASGSALLFTLLCVMHWIGARLVSRGKGKILSRIVGFLNIPGWILILPLTFNRFEQRPPPAKQISLPSTAN